MNEREDGFERDRGRGYGSDEGRTDSGHTNGDDEVQELRVTKIENGTVIDHVTGGAALTVLAILGIDGSAGEAVSVGMNVPSDRLGHKDIVKIEGRELSQDELDVLSLIAPAATINIVREYEVLEKHRVERPEKVTGVLSCPNPNCITVGREPVASTFDVRSDGVRCVYCETFLREDLTEHIDLS